MRLAVCIVVVVTALVMAVVVAGEGAGKLPATLANYRSWTMTTKMRSMPRELAMACTPPSLPAEAREQYGPHALRWINVYVNATAAAAMEERDLRAFPAGSIIAKEKLINPSGTTLDGVAFMIKHEKGKFAASGGWEFLYDPKPENKDAYDGCVTCHRAGAKRDYVFATLKDDAADD